jgi:anthranilate synthase component 2
MKILVFDNYDSFTYNLVHYVKQLGYKDVDVYRNDKIALADIAIYDKILLSPGPGIPSEAGILLDVIKEYGATKSILGVCLGHQAIGEAYGCSLENMDKVLHGIATPLEVIKHDAIYNGLPAKFNVGRYHSWQIKSDSLTPEIMVTAIDDKGSIMSIRHKTHQVVGVQYHPESVLTEHGIEIMKNWLEN